MIDNEDKKQLPVNIIEGIELAHYKIKQHVPAIGKEATLEWYHKNISPSRNFKVGSDIEIKPPLRLAEEGC